MRIPRPSLLIVAGLLATLAVRPGADTKPSSDWPSFRGLNAQGLAEGFRTPITWNADESDGKKSENVLWKTAIPGLAHSSPIISGNRLFVTTALSGKDNPELKVGLYGDGDSVEDDTVHSWQVYCLDKATGKVLWQRTAHKGVPKIKRHPKATQANSTMATDGKHAVAFFGSEGLYCYDFEGKLLWKKDFGVLESGPYNAPSLQWGFASSPVIHDGRVVVQCDALNTGFIASLDVRNGRELWRTPRQDVATWSTPTVCVDGTRSQIVVNGWKNIAGYDFKSGKELWTMAGGGDIPVPTPVVSGGLVYIANAHGRLAPLYAIKTTATGDITLKDEDTSNAHVAWWERRNGAYMQTPLIHGELIYSCRDSGVLSCYEAKTGKRLYQERLGTGRTGFSASPVAADGKLYQTSEEGDIYVVQLGPEFKQLARNSMGEICMATPAISEGVLYFRTRSNLVAVGERVK